MEIGHFANMAAGLRFLRRDKLLVITGTIMVTNFLDAAKGSVIFPVYANEIFADYTDW
jgi:hypothetical protein